MTTDLSYKAIFHRINALNKQRDDEIEKVNTAIKDLDIDAHLKMKLIDAIYDRKKSQMEILTKMLEVAEWHQLEAHAKKAAAEKEAGAA